MSELDPANAAIQLELADRNELVRIAALLDYESAYAPRADERWRESATLLRERALRGFTSFEVAFPEAEQLCIYFDSVRGFWSGVQSKPAYFTRDLGPAVSTTTHWKACDPSALNRRYAVSVMNDGDVQSLFEAAAAYGRINTPDVDDFVTAVTNEALHQRERWTATDPEKSDAEWFWTLGYLGGKAIRPDATTEKRLHHIVAAAALCLNWHAAAMVPTKEDAHVVDSLTA